MSEQTERRERGAPQASRPYLPKGYGVPASDEGLLPWSHVEERMSGAINYWVATTRPDGRPHVVPLWGAWLDGTFYFEGGPDTRWGRNLQTNPAVTVHLESGSDVVILEGIVEQITGPDPPFATRLADAMGGKYGSLGYRPTADQWNEGGLYVVRPHVAFAWTTFPRDATRFRFGGE